MGPTSSIPRGKSLVFEDYWLWLELSAPGVEGVTGFFCRGFATQSIGMRGYGLCAPTRVPAEVGVKVTKHVANTDSSGVSFVTASGIYQEGCSPLRGGPRVGGLQHWQLYFGRSFHAGVMGR